MSVSALAAEGTGAEQEAKRRGERWPDTQLVSLPSQRLAEALRPEQGLTWTEDLQVRVVASWLLDRAHLVLMENDLVSRVQQGCEQGERNRVCQLENPPCPELLGQRETFFFKSNHIFVWKYFFLYTFLNFSFSNDIDSQPVAKIAQRVP